MNLVRAEFDRLFARRFVRLMLVLLVVAFGVTVATTLAGSHQPSANELAQAEQQAELSYQNSLRWYEGCVNIGGSRVEPSPLRGPCDGMRPVRPRPAQFLDDVFVFDEQIRPLTYFLIAFLVLFAFLVGASYIGADLGSGGITNLLLWRPRRMVVLGTKLGTLLVAVLGISVAASVIYLGAFWGIAQASGLPGNLDADFWRWLSLAAGRGLVLVLMAGSLGFSIATLGRHSAAALGVVAAYGVVWEGGARVVMEIVETRRPELWMLSSYVGAWQAGKIELWDNHGCNYGDCMGSYTLGWPVALVVLLIVVGALVVGAFAAFRRRDLA